MARLFISHSSANNGAAFALRDWLCEQGFDDVFLDVDPGRGLVAGERWQEALKAAADRCEVVLFLVSPAWMESKWCLAEFLLAKTLHKRIFGLLVEAVPRDRVPVEMTAEWQLCDLTGTDRVRSFEMGAGPLRRHVCLSEAGLDLLRRGLERAGLDARSFPWPPAHEPDRATASRPRLRSSRRTSSSSCRLSSACVEIPTPRSDLPSMPRGSISSATSRPHRWLGSSSRPRCCSRDGT